MTAWRRLRSWQRAGVWERLHELLLAELHAAGLVDGGGVPLAADDGREPEVRAVPPAQETADSVRDRA
jgi:hypothetical protein